MRRLPPLLIGLGLLLPTVGFFGSAFAASAAPLTAGEARAAHVLKSAPVFTDPTAEAAPAVAPNKIRAIIGTSAIKVAIMPATATPTGQSADDVAAAVLGATGRDSAVIFALVGREFGAAAGARSGLSSSQVQTIAHAAFAAHQAGGFTHDNVEAVLKESATQAKGALLAVPSPVPSPAAVATDTSTSDTTHKDPPAWLVIGAVVIVVGVVFTVAVMSRLTERSRSGEAPVVSEDTVPAAPVVPTQPDPEPVGTEVPEATVPVVDDDAAVTGELPVIPPPPGWAWTGGEWEQVEPIEPVED